MSPHLEQDVNVLRGLFPELPTLDRREALMAALYDEYSERNLAEVLGTLFGQDRHLVLAQAIDAQRRLQGSPVVTEMRNCLLARGWVFADDQSAPPSAP